LFALETGLWARPLRANKALFSKNPPF